MVQRRSFKDVKINIEFDKLMGFKEDQMIEHFVDKTTRSRASIASFDSFCN